jgi:hypothetical protein
MNTDRPWTTLWDRTNHRVLLLAGRRPGEHHWSFARHDTANSVEHVYDVRRDEGGAVVFVDVQLDDNDTPLGFPQHLLDQRLLGSMTIWPRPNLDSFIWWHDND